MNYLPRIVRPRPASSPKFTEGSSFSAKYFIACVWISLAAVLPVRAAVLLDENFDGGISGWTVVQPPGAYHEGPLRWEYDVGERAFFERSNISTDLGGGSTSGTAPMLINGAWADAPFAYRARLTAGDDDGFGLVFGYRNESNYFRITFAQQPRTNFPRRGWSLDRMSNGVHQVLAGSLSSFIPTLGQPFTVALDVDSAQRLTLDVVDDPGGAAKHQRLIDRQALPATAAGQVGMFAWGMAGGDPPGFRIQNVELEPGGLQGGEPFGNWEAVVPSRANGSVELANWTGGVGRARWTVEWVPRGRSGALVESSRAGAGYDMPGNVDFTGPTLVAGDAGWSNYVVATRIVPRDYFGFGLLLRYQNPSNFYRLGLRATPWTGEGMRSGLTVQKRVAGTYSSVYVDPPSRFVPAQNVPFDLVAEIRSNVLQVVAVSDPDGAAQVVRWSPIALTGLDRGRMGLFSWFMSPVEFDRVRVCAGAPLYVSAAHGAPFPPRGLNDFEIGARIDAVAGADESGPGIRRTAIGWTGAGSVPAKGTGNSVSFVLDSFSQLHWRWKTEFRFAATNGPGGRVVGPAEGWLPEGTSVVVAAQSDPGYVFVGWTGDVQSQQPVLNLVMDRPFDLTANFEEDRDA
ncbi:MAG TPA: hypothetical protein P5204_12340, partial [Kiritimatiellia bacterium]|nr:hypothetical protein [Kiritimatiellia bacterium]